MRDGAEVSSCNDPSSLFPQLGFRSPRQLVRNPFRYAYEDISREVYLREGTHLGGGRMEQKWGRKKAAERQLSMGYLSHTP